MQSRRRYVALKRKEKLPISLLTIIIVCVLIRKTSLIACEQLRNYTKDELDTRAIEREIAELKLTLDLLT